MHHRQIRNQPCKQTGSRLFTNTRTKQQGRRAHNARRFVWLRVITQLAVFSVFAVDRCNARRQTIRENRRNSHLLYCRASIRQISCHRSPNIFYRGVSPLTNLISNSFHLSFSSNIHDICIPHVCTSMLRCLTFYLYRRINECHELMKTKVTLARVSSREKSSDIDETSRQRDSVGTRPRESSDYAVSLCLFSSKRQAVDKSMVEQVDIISFRYTPTENLCPFSVRPVAMRSIAHAIRGRPVSTGEA